MTLKAAFIFLSPDAQQERSVVATNSVELTVAAVRNYNEAVTVSQELVTSGIQSIELCGGFGHAGVALIANAVGDKACIGAVRFDCHPGLDGNSGDGLFAG